LTRNYILATGEFATGRFRHMGDIGIAACLAKNHHITNFVEIRAEGQPQPIQSQRGDWMGAEQVQTPSSFNG